MNAITRRTALGAMAGAALTPRAAWAADDIVVGATVPITGPLAGSGLQYYDALQMAQDDINAAGGINGRQFRIVFEDTQASNSVAVNAFIKIVQQDDPCFVFLSSYTIQNLAVEQAVRKAEVPTVYAGGAIAVSDKHNPFMFRIRPPDSVTGAAVGSALVDKLKAKDVGILFVQDDYGTASANAVEATITKAGARVVARESYNARDNDFSPQLLSLKNKGCQAMVAFSYVRDGALVATQRRTLGITTPMIGSTSFVVPSLLDLVTPADVEGIYSMIDAVLGASRSPASADYMTRFNNRFKMRADPFGSCYYDAAMILADALRKVGPDKAKIRDYFANVKDYKGVTRDFTTDSLNDMAHTTALVDFIPGTKEFRLVANYPAQT